jgi:hypothetical protein
LPARGLQAAKRRGIKLGGWTAGSERSAKEAAALAERMRPVMAQLAGLEIGIPRQAWIVEYGGIDSDSGGRASPARLPTWL